MKKSFRTLIAIVVVLMMVFSLSSCSIFQAMRDAQNNVEETTIYADPAENEMISTFNKHLTNSIETASAINWSSSYGAGSVKVLNADGEEAGILDDAASQIKNFIMSSKPGAASGTLENNNTDGTLLAVLDEASVLNFTYERNYATENVTDEDGHEVTDEDGNTVTVTYVSDNLLDLVLNYFEDKAVNEEAAVEETVAEETTVEETAAEEETEAEVAEASEVEETTVEETTVEETTVEETTAEETTVEETTAEEATEETTVEETTAEETTRVYADDATIESIFGSLKDKEAVIAQFECVKDYLVLNDYSIEYADCSVKSEMDLENEQVSFVTFTKNMVVTASVTGVGALEKYGELTVTFNLTQTTNYNFDYTVAAVTE